MMRALRALLPLELERRLEQGAPQYFRIPTGVDLRTGLLAASVCLCGVAAPVGRAAPDPRDDLAGIDARRKALILARKLGKRLNMEDVRVESLVPPGLESMSLDEFWRRLPEADPHYAARVSEGR